MTHISSKLRLLSVGLSSSFILHVLLSLFLLAPLCVTHASFFNGWMGHDQKDSIPVMFVHSLSSDHPFYVEQNEGLEEALTTCSRPVQVIHKYLNCRFWGKEEEYTVCRSFCQDARTSNVEVILCEGDQALYSLLHCGDSLTHTLPLFYNGTCINGPKLTNKYPNVRGCQAPIDFEEMFIKMQSLFPDRHKYVILRDRRALSQEASKQLKIEFAWYKQFNEKLQLNELDVEDSEFKSNYYKLRTSARENVLIIPYWGEIFYPIFREMQAPIVSFQSEALRENIFGVYAPKREVLGRQLGFYTAQFINNGFDFKSEISFIDTPYHWSCDYSEISRFGLHPSDFPEDTHWKNRPLDPRIRFLIISLLVVIFTVLVCTLIFIIRRYRHVTNEKLVSETRAEAQKPLLIQRQHFADVLAHEHMGVISYNKLGEILFLNDCAADILELSEEERGQVFEENNPLNVYNLCTLSHGYKIQLLTELTHQVSEQNPSVVIPSFTYIKLTSTEKSARISGSIRYVVDEQTPSYLMTVKKMTDEDLKDELANLSVDVHRIFPFVYDFVTDSYHFTGAQPAYMNNVQNSSTFKLEDLLPFIHVDDIERVLREVKTSFTHLPVGQNLQLTYRVLNNMQEWEWFENRFRIIQMGDSENQLVGIGICQSIQENKERESQLMDARDKAKQADLLKTAFLANMSHEIRTPLNSIVGFSSLLKHMDEFTQEEITEYIDLINKNCDMLLNLIGDILELSKIESGSMDFNIDTHPLHAILEEVMKSQKVSMNDGVDLLCHVPSNIQDTHVHVDPVRLRQVLHNLINNSKKFTESGSITLGCELEETDKCYVLFVEDTGIGMSDEQCENAFQRFYKADSFTQGAGLGLSICQTIVQRMDGHISVTSEKGKGSRFEVRLPLI